ncbi:ABC transporter substrate-binding protein [Imhoffiella purpurea]|nr:ABC transporter substrate-binding protein [Imhoffiella purpurea]
MKRSFIILRVLCAFAVLIPISAPVAADSTDLPKVVSTNLCADLLLLRIAAPEQILSVSTQAQDPRVSSVAEAALAYPPNRGGVEDLLYLKPDMALVYTGWTGRRHAELLAGRGTEIVAMPYPTTWTDTLKATREMAARIGCAEAGEARILDAEARMRVLRERIQPYRVLYLRPSGGTAGSGTYVDDLLRLLGLRNVAAEAGFAGWGRFPLERLVTAPPDLFLLGYFDRSGPGAASAYGRHPLLRRMLERIPSVSVPVKDWGCGGLELVDAAERIVAQIESLPVQPSLIGQAHP